MATVEDSSTVPNKGLLRSTSIVASMTMLSRVCGFIRDMVIAQLFGADAQVDAFLVAFKIPNFMRRLFAEGAFSQAFVPVLAQYSESRSRDEVKQFISHMAATLGIILLAVTLLAELAAPLVVSVFSPGFIGEPLRFNLATDLLRVTFPYLFFISLTAFVSAVLNTYGRFAIPAFTPVLLNLSLIVFAVFFSPHFQEPVTALAWGVFAAGVLQLCFQLPFLHRLGLLTKPKIKWNDPGVKRVLLLMLPALFGVSVAQISLLLDTVFASFLPVGSIAWLYYSDRISSLPLGVFGVAIATVVLPHLSRKHADNDHDNYSKALDWGIRWVLLLGVPAAVGLLLLAGPLLTTLFQYGEFSISDVGMTRKSLLAFAVGVPSFMLVKVLAAAFYARQNIKTPVKYAVIALITNVTLMIILIFPLRHAGIALATSLASMLNSGLLLWGLLQRKIYLPSPGWKKFFIQIAMANSAMALLLYFGRGQLAQWLQWSWRSRGSHLAILIIAAIVVYFVGLYVTGIRLRKLTQAP